MYYTKGNANLNQNINQLIDEGQLGAIKVKDGLFIGDELSAKVFF